MMPSLFLGVVYHLLVNEDSAQCVLNLAMSLLLCVSACVSVCFRDL